MTERNLTENFGKSDLYTLFVEEMKDYAMLMVNPGGRIIAWNKGAENVFGFREKEILGQHFRVIFTRPDQESGVPEKEIKKAFQDGVAEDERWHKRKDDTLFFADGRLRAIYDGNKLIAYGKAVRDLTERKALEQQLQAAAEREKRLNERLKLSMIETNHRVKNNLQLISSLLSLQLRKRGNISKEDLEKITRHIHGLGAMHDVLSAHAREDAELDTVSAKEVLEKLIKINDSAMEQHITADLDDVQISTKQCSSLAVIVNELLSNSLKHGADRVNVRLKIIGHDLAEFEILDDGPGFSEDFSKSKGSMGSMIVNSLCNADFSEPPCYENREEGGARVSFKIRSRNIAPIS